ncbi:hypothetical protein B0A50_07156 [Salinomyces thailandicus]|uniref:HD domain-containing protein n=1 Tax=Salinomyces thailandicus TaxID=706561 RepID=A0A4U0TMX0_9PEZI|nr:hypothetical protein B0A50_07156 [Salinomyces thailandica]
MVKEHIPDVVPSDEVSTSAYDNASRELLKPILNHSLRVFLFAKALAAREHSDWASPRRLPLLFAACIYHDMGTSCGAHSPSRFEVEGADAAERDLRSLSVSETDAHEVWVAIALHTSPHIAERISSLARLVRLAVLMDFKRKDALTLTTEEEVAEFEGLFPRLEAEQVLGDAVVQQALKRPEKAPAASWAGVLLKSKLENPDWEGVNKAF